MAQRRVLVADDDPVNLAGMCELLTYWGHDVTGAADGKMALKAADSRRPDVAIVDLGLPDGDGLAVIRQLKADGMFVIAFSWNKAELAARAAGADAFVLKSNLDQLKRLLREAAPRGADAIDVPPGRKT